MEQAARVENRSRKLDETAKPRNQGTEYKVGQSENDFAKGRRIHLWF